MAGKQDRKENKRPNAGSSSGRLPKSVASHSTTANETVTVTAASQNKSKPEAATTQPANVRLGPILLDESKKNVTITEEDYYDEESGESKAFLSEPAQ